MQNAGMPIELREQDAPGIWPWIIGVVAFILLTVSVRTDLKQIPLSLSRQAHTLAASQEAPNININVDGRDLAMSGTLSPGVDRDSLVQSISSIEGVRVVVDDMTEFNPEERARLELLGFKQSLHQIDFSQVSFERGSAQLTTTSQSALLQLVQLLKAYPQYRVRVGGHTDNTGRAEVNLRISRERAGSVADFLLDGGVSAQQLISQGYGATRPIADNATEAGRTANRRIEVSYVN